MVSTIQGKTLKFEKFHFSILKNRLVHARHMIHFQLHQCHKILAIQTRAGPTRYVATVPAPVWPNIRAILIPRVDPNACRIRTVH